MNIIFGNIKNQITGIYHGVSKRDIPLFLQEQAYRFNHRFTGNEMMQKIKKYIIQSTPIPNKSIIKALNTAEPYFTPSCVWWSVIFHFSILVCTIYLIYVYSFQKGCISKLLKPNVIVDYIYQLSFPIYLFHFILLKIISLSPKLSPWNNIYINFIEVLVIINIGYYIVHSILKKKAKQ